MQEAAGEEVVCLCVYYHEFVYVYMVRQAGSGLSPQLKEDIWFQLRSPLQPLLHLPLSDQAVVDSGPAVFSHSNFY